jgi:hypothetical protein
MDFPTRVWMNHLLWMIVGVSAHAQIRFEIGPRNLPVNRQLQFTIVVEQDTSRMPSFPEGLKGGPGFRLISNRPSTNFSTTIINGRMTQKREFTYLFEPVGEGSFLFPAQVVQVGTESAKSPETSIVVTEAETTVARRSPMNPFGSSPFGPQRRSTRDPELFAEMVVPETTVYVGQALPIKVNLYYYGVDIIGSGSRMDWPSLDGFWMEDVTNQEERPQRVVRQGKEYTLSTVGERLLYPTKEGTLTLDPVSFDLVVNTGGFFGDRQRVQRQTEPVTIQVKPLPQPAPPGFEGAVGRFELSVTADKSQTKAGEAISLEVSIQGEGNLSTIGEPRIPDLDQVERFDGGAPVTAPLARNQIRKTWTYALVPKKEGPLTLPSLSLVYFDPQRRTYETQTSEVLQFEVLPGEALPAGVTSPETDGEVTAPQEILSFLKTQWPMSRPLARRNYQPLHFWVTWSGVLVSLLVLSLVTLAWGRFQQRSEEFRHHQALARFKKELKRLKKLESLKHADFFEGLSTAAMTYFGDKMQREPQGLSSLDIEKFLGEQHLDDEWIQQLLATLESIDLARYIPSEGKNKLELAETLTRQLTQIEGHVS